MKKIVFVLIWNIRLISLCKYLIIMIHATCKSVINSNEPNNSILFNFIHTKKWAFFLYKNEKKRKNIRHYTSVRSRIQKTLTANQQGTNTYLTLKIIPQMVKKNWRENGIHAATWCNKDRDKSWRTKSEIYQQNKRLFKDINILTSNLSSTCPYACTVYFQSPQISTAFNFIGLTIFPLFLSNFPNS